MSLIETTEYQQGFAAYSTGKGVEDCPHESYVQGGCEEITEMNSRYRWFCGYYAARGEEILKKHGETDASVEVPGAQCPETE